MKRLLSFIMTFIFALSASGAQNVFAAGGYHDGFTESSYKVLDTNIFDKTVTDEVTFCDSTDNTSLVRMNKGYSALDSANGNSSYSTFTDDDYRNAIKAVCTFYKPDGSVNNDPKMDIYNVNINSYGYISDIGKNNPRASYILVYYYGYDSSKAGRFFAVPYAFRQWKQDTNNNCGIRPKKIYVVNKDALSDKYYPREQRREFDYAQYFKDVQLGFEYYSGSEIYEMDPSKREQTWSLPKFDTQSLTMFEEKDIKCTSEHFDLGYGGATGFKLKLNKDYEPTQSGNVSLFYSCTPTPVGYDDYYECYIPVFDSRSSNNVVSLKQTQLCGIKVKTQPNKVDYIEGEKFDKTGLKLQYEFSPGADFGNLADVPDSEVKYQDYPLSREQKSVLLYVGSHLYFFDTSYNGTSYTTEQKISVTPKAVSSIAIKTQPSKKTYIAGQSFDPSGLVAEATYNDNTKETLNNKYLDYIYKTGSSFTAGENSIKVSYGGKEAVINGITVKNKTVASIKVTHAPDKIKYFSGQSFDRDGMVVTAFYDDDSKADITGYTVSPDSALTSADKKVTISFSSKTCEQPIVVEDKSVTGITISKQPSTTQYKSGQKFNKAGMEVKAHYSDGSESNISDYEVSDSPLVAGQKEVYVTYSSFFASVNVTVDEVVSLSGIKITKQPNRKSYVAGERFIKDGMEVKAVYSDSHEDTITNYTLSSDVLCAGQNKIYVTYNNFYAAVDITVSDKAIRSIKIKTPPSKTSYVEGELFSPSGMVVQAEYTDSSVADLASTQYTYNNVPLKTTDKSIVIQSGGKQASQAIKVAAKEITSVAVTAPPARINYISGQSFDPKGMEVTATYNDNSHAVISDYDYNPKVINEETEFITVSKNQKSAQTPVVVSSKEVTSIKVTTQPKKTKYFAGQNFEKAGMVVTGYYNDGTSAELNNYTVSDEPLAAGQSEVYVTYNNLYATTPVEVSAAAEITSIKVTSPPTKTSYVAGQSFEKAGLVVKAVYSDGTEKNIDNYTLSSDTLSAGQDKVYITYNNFYTFVTISVSDKEITGIEITKKPDVTDYVEGEVFNPGGMVVKAVYSDHTYNNLAPGDYTYKSAPLKTTDKTVVISAGDMTAGVEINVVAKQMTAIKIAEPPEKTIYVAGQPFDPQGMTVKASFNDGSEAVISDYEYSPKVITEEVSKVTVSKNGFTASTPVSVSDKEILSIKVTQPPDKISYIAGQKFSRRGMEVTAYYNDGDSAILSDFETDDNILAAGQTQEYITYDNVYTTTPIQVIDKVINGIKIEKQPTKNSYVAGEEFNPSGMAVKATYSDGTEETVERYNYSPAILTMGTSNVVITYNNYFTNVPVSVTKKAITSISVEHQPDKTRYVEGEIFDSDGMLIKAAYNDNSSATLAPDEYTYDKTPLTSDVSSVEIRAGSAAASVSISVDDKAATKIEVTRSPSKINYVVGQNFIKDGMEVTAFYNDSTSAVISDYTCSPTVINGDTKEITVSKDGLSDTVAIIVEDKIIDSIKVTTPPNVKDYFAGQTFRKDGMAVTAYYNDGTDSVIYDYAVSESPLTANQREVYITHDNLYCTTPVNVKDKEINAVKIAKEPAKVSYIAGQEFDPKGMVVNATYSDGSESEIKNYSYSPAVLKSGTEKVIITYDKYFADVNVSVADKEISSITADKGPTKTQYVEGEIFNPAGMLIKAAYNDGTSDYLAPNEYSFSQSPLAAGETEVEIRAGSAMLKVSITVAEKQIKTLEVTKSPDKINYVVGQNFDTAGMVVTAFYNDGTNAEVHDYTYEPKVITSGLEEVTVTKDGISDKVKIQTDEKAVTYIRVTTPPHKTNYVAGQLFVPDGMVVTAYYNDGSSQVLSSGDYSVSSSPLTAGQKEVIITYDNLYCSTPVNTQARILTGIRADVKPTKLSYVDGQEFVPDGMVLKAAYSDGSEEEINEYMYYPVILRTGNKEVKVTYESFFVNIPVSVASKEITALSVKKEPEKVTYIEGEVFSDYGMLIEAAFNDNTKDILSADEYTFSKLPLTTDDRKVTINAGNASTDIPVRVIDKAITDIEVTKAPKKIAYITGQSFDTQGMVVRATYNDNTQADISDYTYSPEIISADTDEITVSKDGLSDTVAVSVTDRMADSIKVTTPPEKTTYIAGQYFSKAGMKVTAHFNDGTEEELKESDYEVSDAPLVMGQKEVIITYNNLFTSIPVTVEEMAVTSIKITKAPDKVSYIDGQEFSPQGMAVTAVYTDGSEKEVNNYTWSPAVVKKGEENVIITYDKFITTQPISVAAKEITSITADTKPDKLQYVEGELFDEKGMLIKAAYNDNTESFLAPNEYSYSKEPLTADDMSVTISAGDASTEIAVKVVKKEIESIKVTKTPDVIRYISGQQFNPKGMTVTASYNDGTSAEIHDYEYYPETMKPDTENVLIYKGQLYKAADGSPLPYMCDISDMVSVVVDDRVVESIEVTAPPDKRDYVAGEVFDPEGMVVTAAFNDGSREEIFGYQLMNDIITPGQKEVYITYYNLFCTVKINVVDKELTDIKITTPPDKVDYVDGQKFDPAGMVVTGYYNDGTSSEIKGYELDTDTMKTGQTKVYVTYGEKFYDSIDVSVVEKAITRLEVVEEPSNKNYVEGQVFDPSGLMLRAYYNDGSDEILTKDKYSYSTDPLKAEDTKAELSAGGQKAYVSVFVEKKVITDLKITNPPDKVSYVAGQVFSKEGMEVTAYFNDNTSAVIEDYTISPDVITEDTAKITVSKDSHSAEVSVSAAVKAAERIEVTAPPKKLAYLAGEVFDPEGMVVTAYYNDGEEKEIKDYTYDEFTLSAGTAKVYITFDNLFTTVPITVNSKSIEHIEIIKPPVKTEYVDGEAFDTTGMVVKAFYDDGSEEILENYTYKPDVMVMGVTLVSVERDGKSADQQVSVTEKTVTGIEITVPPDKLEYREGEVFDPEGMEVTAYFNDKTSAVINNYTYNTDPLKAGDSEITVEYQGFSDSVGITLTLSDENIYSDISERNGDVNRDNKVSAEDAAILTKYISHVQEDFNVHAIHTGDIDGDGSITEDDVTLAKNCTNKTITLEGDSLKNADITADGYVTQLDVTLLEKAVLGMWSLDTIYEANADANDDTEINMLDVIWIINSHYNKTTIDHIEIATPPDKTKYVEGQVFEPEGMAVEAVYKDGSRQTVTDYTYSEEPLKLTDTSVEIEYEGHTAMQSIEVIKKVISGSEDDSETATDPGTGENTEETTAFTGEGNSEMTTDSFSEGSTEETTEDPNAGTNSSGVRIIRLPYKVEYVEGQVFDPAGILIEISWNDGSKTEIDENDVETDTAPLKLTDRYGVVYYSYANGREKINVPIKVTARAIVSVEVVTPPDKTEYVEGQVFDPAGMVVEVTYNDGSKEQYTSERLHSDDTPLTTDDTKVTVTTDNGISAETDVTVAERQAVSAEVVTPPDRKDYVEGQSFDPSGMVVEVTYNDGTTEEYSADELEFDDRPLGTDDTKFTVTADGIDAETDIYVEERAAVSVEVVTPPDKTDYVEGQYFDPKGMEVEVKYNDGSVEHYTGDDFMPPEAPLTTDDTDVSVSTDNGISVDVDVSVEPRKAVSAEVITPPDKTEYVEGQVFDPAGMVVEVTYNDGSTEQFMSDDLLFAEDPFEMGDTKVTVNADGIDVETDVTVTERKAVSAEVVTPPDKTEYSEGEYFDPSGMEVEVHYNDGTTERFGAEDLEVKDNGPLTPGDTKVTVTADGAEADVDVTVEAAAAEETTTYRPFGSGSGGSSGGGGGGSGPSKDKNEKETTTEPETADEDENSEDTTEENIPEEEYNEEENEHEEEANRFKDMEGHWAEDYVEALHENGILNGVTDELFCPENSTKRGDFAMVLDRILKPDEGDVTFDDVPEDSYYAQAISNCAAAGIYIGYGDGTFRPEKTITREELMVVMGRLFSGKDIIPLSIYYEELSKFADGASVSWWAAPYVNYLCGIDAVLGDDDGCLRPQDDITRAEMSVVIYNFIHK